MDSFITIRFKRATAKRFQEFSADGEDKKVRFKLQQVERGLPQNGKEFLNEDLQENFERIYDKVKSIFEN